MKNKSLFLLVSILVIIAIAWGTFLGFGSMDAWISRLALGLDIEGGVAVVFEGEQGDLSNQEFDQLLEQTKAVLTRRVDSFGLNEPNITRSGSNRIRIELPGAKDVDAALASIGKTAILEFYQVNEGEFVVAGMPVTGDFPGKLLFRGDSLKDAGVGMDQYNQSTVVFTLSKEAADLFADASRDIVEKYAAKVGQIAIVLDGEVISAPMVEKVLSTEELMITGNFTPEEAISLSNLIRGGALPISLQEVQTSYIDATLGREALSKSVFAGILGFVLVVLIMSIRYRLPGVLASIALVLYTALLFLLMILFRATLTLPGIAGLVLSIGMAVDANVIIFERLREELGLGKSLRSSLRSSFKRAMTTIVDSNVTTLLAAVILYYFGEGPIKGFAITLSLGILLSMFSAIVVTRSLLSYAITIPALRKTNFYVKKEVGHEDNEAL
ncbi:MAG TPA: protein translocase subunit SecD [Tissierellia bacterium]|nr:protein translocase subunit SecD [Tissierellia bacterium]